MTMPLEAPLEAETKDEAQDRFFRGAAVTRERLAPVKNQPGVFAIPQTEWQFALPADPIPEGWREAPIQLRLYARRVAFAREVASQGGRFNAAKFRRLYPSSSHTRLLCRPLKPVVFMIREEGTGRPIGS